MDQSFTRAAGHLSLSQPALSKLIKKLGREIHLIGCVICVLTVGVKILAGHGVLALSHPIYPVNYDEGTEIRKK